MAEVQSLLARSGSELTSVLVDSVARSGLEILRFAPGDRIGPYRIIELLGDGGMGSVYLAEQLEPIQREVAIKVIKAGMDTEQVVRRFEAERQVLAMMDHPNVAKVLDAGATPSGRPYFVMEVVRGEPLLEYCQRLDLDIRSRLRLMMAVCAGVQHAHLRGVLHRDLKPSNILVNEQGEPLPKIIDFGIAKAQSLANIDMTMVGSLVGTLEYMSPEQADGMGDLDTRTDVYALGVILFKLLTGRLPFEQGQGKNADTDQLRRAIRHDTPPRPSQLAASGQLAVDLDWITLKALTKERELRYSSAAELGSDLARFLADKPVQAGAPTAAYRLRKLVRRNRVATMAIAFTLLAIIAGTTATAWQAIKASDERDRAIAAVQRANQELDKANALQNFLVNDFLRSPHPELAGREVKVADLLDNASQTAATHFSNNPLQEAVVRVSLGRTYSGLGLNAEAEQELQSARSLYENLGDGFKKEILEIQHLRIHILYQLDQNDTGLEVAEETAAARTRLLGVDDPATLETKLALASMLLRNGRETEADSLADQAFAGLRRQLADDDKRLLSATQLRAQQLGSIPDRRDEAAQLLRDLLVATESLMGADSPRTAFVRSSLANALLSQDNRFEEAEVMLRRVVVDNRRLLGPTHHSTVGSICSLATTLGFLGRSAESEEQFELCIELAAEGDGVESFEYLLSVHNYATILTQKENFAKADSMGALALDLALKIMPNDGRSIGAMYQARCVVLTELKRYEEAVSCGATAIAKASKTAGPADWQVTKASFTLAESYDRWGKRQKSREILETQYRLVLQAYGPANTSPQLAVTKLSLMLQKHGLHEQAVEHLLEYETLLTAAGETGLPMLGAIYGEMTRLYEATGNEEKAERYRRLSP